MTFHSPTVEREVESFQIDVANTFESLGEKISCEKTEKRNITKRGGDGERRKEARRGVRGEETIKGRGRRRT